MREAQEMQQDKQEIMQDEQEMLQDEQEMLQDELGRLQVSKIACRRTELVAGPSTTVKLRDKLNKHLDEKLREEAHHLKRKKRIIRLQQSEISEIFGFV